MTLIDLNAAALCNIGYFLCFFIKVVQKKAQHPASNGAVNFPTIKMSLIMPFTIDFNIM